MQIIAPAREKWEGGQGGMAVGGQGLSRAGGGQGLSRAEQHRAGGKSRAEGNREGQGRDGRRV